MAPSEWDPDAVVDLTALESANFVSYEECDYVFGRWFDQALGAQPSRLRGVCHFERIEEVLATVADGRGLSIVPEHASRPWAADGRVRHVRPDGRRALNTEYVVTRPGRVMRPEVMEILRQVEAKSEG